MRLLNTKPYYSDAKLLKKLHSEKILTYLSRGKLYMPFKQIQTANR
ncbi:MAG: hypothetical protein LBT27_00795 [Prevotellaceae bacterium]|nr:hypothetical protein [Prevotellaceae bacterium]